MKFESFIVEPEEVGLTGNLGHAKRCVMKR